MKFNQVLASLAQSIHLQGNFDLDIPTSRNSSRLSIKVIGASLLGIFLTGFAWMQFSESRTGFSIKRADIMIATVQKEDLLVDVKAPGTLQPTSLRWIAASSEARVEQIYIQPGARVRKDTLIMQLSNPTLERNLESAGYALQVEEAELTALSKRLQSNYLSQEAVVADFEAQYQNATFRLKANQALSGLQIVSELDAKENELLQAQLSRKVDIEKKRLAQLSELNKAELEAKQARVNQARSLLSLQQELRDNLAVRSGLEGILQQVPVEQGQLVTSGVVLARVAQEDKFKAELRVQESQAKDVSLGQKAQVRAGNQQVTGIVARIDPAVQSGVVIVDVEILDGQLAGARPDLRITASIEIEMKENVLTLRRPVSSQPDSQAQLYVLNESNKGATRHAVNLGKGSLDKIQVVSGLKLGSKVIVSDTRTYNQVPLLNLE